MDKLKTLLQVAVESNCKCILSPEQAKQALEMQTEIERLKSQKLFEAHYSNDWRDKTVPHTHDNMIIDYLVVANSEDEAKSKLAKAQSHLNIEKVSFELITNDVYMMCNDSFDG